MAKKHNIGKLVSSDVGFSKSNLFVIDDETLTDPRVRDLIYCPTINGEIKAHGLVPRDYALYPRQMFDPPNDLQLIPQTEWDARIDEQESQQSSLEHIRMTGADGSMIPALDQNGQGYSFCLGTEFLTEKGWVKVEEWNRVDALATVNPSTYQMEFQSPVANHCYEYNDEMYYSTNRRLHFGVTSNHEMLVRKWDESKRTLSNRYTTQRADKLGWYAGMMPAPSGWRGTEFVTLQIPGEDLEYSGDDFISMVSLIVSDGYAATQDNLVSFCCFNKGRYDFVASLALRIGFKEQSSRKGVWNRRSGPLWAWIKENCYQKGLDLRSPNKKVPDVIKCASSRQIKHFLSCYGDQTHNRSNTTAQFFTSSKRLVDDLQELHLRVGKRSTITEVDPRTSIIKSGENVGRVVESKESYILTVGEIDRLCIDRKKHIETDHYKGLVYCASVPNGALITRYQNSVLISHNCWAYSTTTAVMLLRAASNQKYVRLSGHAIGCIVKNYRNEGGWCGLSAKFHRERGCPSVQFWPEKSMSRSNDKPETWANAAIHKTLEEWVDLTEQVYDQNLTKQQIATCLLLNIPVAVDYNEWSHSICALRWMRVEAGSYSPKILNSWTDEWGDKGMSVIRTSWDVDGAVALRVSVPSQT